MKELLKIMKPFPTKTNNKLKEKLLLPLPVVLVMFFSNFIQRIYVGVFLLFLEFVNFFRFLHISEEFCSKGPINTYLCYT